METPKSNNNSKARQIIPSIGVCVATDKIMKDKMLVGFMYREEPEEDIDSGWRFFSGTEDQDYVDDPDNSAVYDLETIMDIDSGIIPYLKMPYGTEMERVEGTDTFQVLKD